MKAILTSLILFTFFSFSSLGQKDQEVNELPDYIKPLSTAVDCSVTWCGQCTGELSIKCSEVLKINDSEASSLRFNVIAKKMPQDEVAFFYKQTENVQFGEKILTRIQKELKVGDIIWFNRISYRNAAGDLVKNDEGFKVALK